MKIKSWLTYSILIIFVSLFTEVYLMYLTDTYSVVHTKRTKFYSMPNTNILRIEYILSNKTKYDSFMFGSSRIWFINPLKIKNGNYYNMMYPDGLPHEHLINIQLFLKNGIKIKNLLIGFDDLSYQVSFETHQNNILKKSHYLATNQNIVSFYKDCFFRFPLKEDRRNLAGLFKDKELLPYSISNQKDIFLDKEKEFSKDKFTSQEHINNKVFDRATYYNGDYVKESINDIYEIKKLCIENKINCTFIVNPLHHTSYKSTNKLRHKEFKEKLSYITSYYDFSIPNSINNNNRYWHETSHYNLEVGDMILNRIYENNTSIKDFGVYVEEKQTNAI